MATLAVTPGAPVSVARGLLSVDGFSTFFKAIFLLSGALTLLLSMRYLDTEGARHGEYVFLVRAATLGMMFMATGTDLITIFIGLETMAIAFYILAGILKPDRRSNEAGVKYFLLGTFSLGILLYGVSILYGMSGTTNLRALAIGGGRPLPELFQAAECRFDFSRETMQPLMQLVRDELKRLDSPGK